MFRAAAVLSTLPLVAAVGMDMNCLMDVGMGAYGLVDAGLAINKAVSSCPKDKAACAADIGQAVSGLGSTSAYISMAVGDCGGQGHQCAVDVSQAVSSLGKATQLAGNAAQTCTTNATAVCVSDVLASASKIALVANDLENAKNDCSRNVQKVYNFNMNCIMDVGMAAFGLLNAGLAANSAAADCAEGGAAGECAADVGKIVSGLGSASASISKAVGDCGGATSQCAVDVSEAVSAIGKATEAAGKAADVCKDKKQHALCLSYVLASGSSLSLSVAEIQKARESC